MFLLSELYLFLFKVHLKLVKFSILSKSVNVVVEIIGSHYVVSLDESRMVEQECRFLGMHEIIASFRHAKTKPSTWFLLRWLSGFIHDRFLANIILRKRHSFGIFHLENVNCARVGRAQQETVVIAKVKEILGCILDSSGESVKFFSIGDAEYPDHGTLSTASSDNVSKWSHPNFEDWSSVTLNCIHLSLS